MAPDPGSCTINDSCCCHVLLPPRSLLWLPIAYRIKFSILSLAFTALLIAHLFFPSLLTFHHLVPFTGLCTHPGLPLNLVHALLQAWTPFFSVSICPSPARALIAHPACLLWKASLIPAAPRPSLPLLNHSMLCEALHGALRTVHPVCVGEHDFVLKAGAMSYFLWISQCSASRGFKGILSASISQVPALCILWDATPSKSLRNGL